MHHTCMQVLHQIPAVTPQDTHVYTPDHSDMRIHMIYIPSSAKGEGRLHTWGTKGCTAGALPVAEGVDLSVGTIVG